ncbi:MAG: flagellar basal body-associated FliL family protein [Acidobacteriota bacterium]
MSDTEKAAAADDGATAPKKGGLKKIMLLLMIVIVLGAGAGGGYFFWRSRTAAAAEVKKTADKKSQAKMDSEGAQEQDPASKPKKNDPLQNALPQDEDVKKVVELPPFIVNLADTEQARYLRMTVSLGVGGEESSSEKPDQLFVTRVRNAMLAVLSDKKSEEILTIGGKATLRKELLQAAQAASEEPQVKAIYITDFIVQL